MNINYLKFKDPRAINNNTFEDSKTLFKQKSKEVEAVGYLVQEDDDSLYIAMQVNGSNFRKILFVPKKNITARKENFKEESIKEVSFTDCQITAATNSISLEKLKTMGKPSDVLTVGFIVRDSSEDIALAMEKNDEGNYRTIVIIPKI